MKEKSIVEWLSVRSAAVLRPSALLLETCSRVSRATPFFHAAAGRSRAPAWARISWLFWLLPLWLSCATRPPVVVDPVGPHPTQANRISFEGAGALQVYTATETKQVGNFTYYYPHTGYFIYGTNGNRLRWVRNAVGNTDEVPTIVRLPAGIYTVIAEDDNFGRVSVPVVIEAGETTNVHLDASRPAPYGLLEIQDKDVVRLPNGRIVGWRAKTGRP